MPTDPSVTIDAETATDLREWLWSLNHEFEHEIPLPRAAVTDCLAEIAAAIDGQLGDDTKQIELSASRTAYHTRDSWSQSPPPYDPVERHTREEPTDIDTGYLETEQDLEREFEELEDHIRAAEFSAAVGDPDIDHVPEPIGFDDAAITVEPAADSDVGASQPDQFVATYQCSVCETERELESSHKVSAFVDDCPACSAGDVRFVAVSLPERRG